MKTNGKLNENIRLNYMKLDQMNEFYSNKMFIIKNKRRLWKTRIRKFKLQSDLKWKIRTIEQNKLNKESVSFIYHATNSIKEIRIIMTLLSKNQLPLNHFLNLQLKLSDSSKTIIVKNKHNISS